MADIEELIERLEFLRCQPNSKRSNDAVDDALETAATLLQSQQRIIGELRAVLSRLAGDPTTHNNDPYDYRNIARAALNKQESLG